MKTFRPWIVVFQVDDDRPIVFGYKTEEAALDTLLEILGLDEDDAENLGDYQDEHGWFCHHGVCAKMQKLEYPVE